MKITITRRVDGSVRIGEYTVKHWATELTYGNDEIDVKQVIDVPDAYITKYGDVAYDGRPICDHPVVRRALRAI
ncbi:hypothetical protein ES708_01014 [subsurface metagenome]